MSYDLHLEFFLPAPPAHVMDLLTNSKLIEEWSGEEGIVEKKEGGAFEMFGGWVKGKVLKATKDELAYTWKPDNWTEEAVPSEVHYKLVPKGVGTNVLVTHTGLPNKEEMDGHESGWSDHFFDLVEEHILND